MVMMFGWCRRLAISASRLKRSKNVGGHRELRVQRLHRDRALHRGLHRAEDDAHAALAEHGLDLVAAVDRAGRGGRVALSCSIGSAMAASRAYTQASAVGAETRQGRNDAADDARRQRKAA
jgi:hypothetical protein